MRIAQAVTSWPICGRRRLRKSPRSRPNTPTRASSGWPTTLERRNRVPDGDGTAATIAKANATTYWLKTNDHTDKLDRAQVSALAKQVIDGKLSWQEAQSRLDDMIDAVTLPTFGAANGAAVKVPVAVSAKPMTERASDPLDELFE